MPYNNFSQARRIKVQSIVDTSGEPDVCILVYGQAILTDFETATENTDHDIQVYGLPYR